MMDRGRWYPVLSNTAVLWQESRENPLIFCYLIGWGAFVLLRSHTVVPIPNSARLETACSNPSFTFSTRSTIPTGSEN